MDIPFLSTTKEEFLTEYIFKDLSSCNKRFIVTANPEIVMHANKNENYKSNLIGADYIVADGIGIVLASKWLKQPIPERIPGFELMCDLIQYAELNELNCYFLGGSILVNETFVEKIKQIYPNLKISGHHHGFFDLKDDQKIVTEIKELKPDIIFVALGMPKQEMWIVRNYQSFEKGVFMGVGGSFDVIAGVVKRAPNIWIKLNLEWLYRLIKQPKRWRRILKVFEFMIKIIVRKR